ncbi:glycosyl transferase family protein [Hortaea werneckii]|nr:glycosyl transferase family protein [Hortaea werneckii]
MATSNTTTTPNTHPDRVVASPKVWTTLITNLAYLPGLLTLEASLREVNSQYPLVALYTDSFPASGHAALDARQIPKQHVAYLLPAVEKKFDPSDSRFYDCWSKLTPFSLVQYDRVVQLDSDMLVRRNMDELMDLPLDGPELKGQGPRVFAASHACVCNPLNKPHYPADWIPANCAFTTQHSDPDLAQREGAAPTAGLAMPNGGLQVVIPSAEVYASITALLASPSSTDSMDFSDQSLLSDLFPGRWVALPYIYNALRPMRWEGIHDAIWRDEEVRNVHFLLNPKPWDETEEMKGQRGVREEINAWWWEVTDRRREGERRAGVVDGF